jgi:flagellar hook assembly protein FlgD
VAVYPNPVGDQGTYFVVSLPYPADLEFKLYDVRGELVWQGKQPNQAVGTYQYHWDANNDAGKKVSYGAYYLLAKARSGNSVDHDGKWLTVLR